MQTFFFLLLIRKNLFFSSQAKEQAFFPLYNPIFCQFCERTFFLVFYSLLNKLFFHHFLVNTSKKPRIFPLPSLIWSAPKLTFGLVYQRVSRHRADNVLLFSSWYRIFFGRPSASQSSVQYQEVSTPSSCHLGSTKCRRTSTAVFSHQVSPLFYFFFFLMAAPTVRNTKKY